MELKSIRKMKVAGALVLIITVAMIIFIYKKSHRLQLMTPKGKMSYSLGLETGKNLTRQGLDIEIEAFIKGLNDGVDGSVTINPKDLEDSKKLALEKARERTREQLAAGSFNQFSPTMNGISGKNSLNELSVQGNNSNLQSNAGQLKNKKGPYEIFLEKQNQKRPKSAPAR